MVSDVEYAAKEQHGSFVLFRLDCVNVTRILNLREEIRMRNLTEAIVRKTECVTHG